MSAASPLPVANRAESLLFLGSALFDLQLYIVVVYPQQKSKSLSLIDAGSVILFFNRGGYGPGTLSKGCLVK
jgi:hypothetical protein